MTTALERGEGSASRPGRFLPPGKTRYPLYRRLGGPQGRSGQEWKISPPQRFDPRIVQPGASRYTDYATRPTDIYYGGHIRETRYLNDEFEENKVPCFQDMWFRRKYLPKSIQWSNTEDSWRERFIFLFNHLQTKRRPLYLKTQSVPRCKHYSSRL